jgi:hypothetical protein
MPDEGCDFSDEEEWSRFEVDVGVRQAPKKKKPKRANPSGGAPSGVSTEGDLEVMDEWESGGVDDEESE